MRLAAAAAVFVICAFLGTLIGEGYKLRLAASDMMASDLAAMEALLRFERTDVRSIAASLAVRGRLKGFWRGIHTELSQGASFEEAWRNRECALSLPADEKAILREFAARFGKSDIETELAGIRQAGESLKNVRLLHRNEFQNRIRLSGALSVLLGAALALMVL